LPSVLGIRRERERAAGFFTFTPSRVPADPNPSCSRGHLIQKRDPGREVQTGVAFKVER